MDAGLKWIGAASAAVVLLFAGATVAGYALEADGNAPQLTAEDVFDFDAQAVATSDDGATAMLDPKAAASAEPETAAAPDPREEFVIKRILPIDGPIKYGQWFWDDEGVPDGPLVVTVDLDARVISAFRGGYEIGAAAAMLGTDEHPTPLGTFPILSKERHNVSEKYGNAPMPWTLRLTWDGVAIHGGHVVENGYASHGCISTPDEFASRLFDIAKKGDIVIITRGKQVGMGQSLVGG